MRDKKGIKFNIVSEDEAYTFLCESNYYFKLKAFSKNFQKYSHPSQDRNKYVNLEFAYLKELSTLDAIFRKIVIKMVLDIEHFLKVQLIKDISENEDVDGYEIVDDYLTKIKPNLAYEIIEKNKNSYTHDMVEKYKDHFAIWNLIEVISFGDFIDLYEYYYAYYNNSYDLKGKLLPVKWLRNAAAHNNCLINKLTPPYSKNITPNMRVMNKISKIKYMPKRTRESKMKNPVIHDFVVMLDVYCSVIQSKPTLQYGLQELDEFIHNRCLKRKEYFSDNDVIKSNYDFLLKVVDFYLKTSYNSSEEQKNN